MLLHPACPLRGGTQVGVTFSLEKVRLRSGVRERQHGYMEV